jgi:hypothetical protein
MVMLPPSPDNRCMFTFIRESIMLAIVLTGAAGAIWVLISMARAILQGIPSANDDLVYF